MPKILHIDIETQSDVNLRDQGVYRYVESPVFGIQLLSYAYGDDPIVTLDLAHGENIPPMLQSDIMNPNQPKIIHNASFERVCFSRKWLFPTQALLDHEKYIDPKGWGCTLVLANYLNLPGALDELGEALNLPFNFRKDKRGKALIQKFSTGRYADMSTIPMDQDWLDYKEYNRQDVEAERAVWNMLMRMHESLYPKLFTEYQISERINDHGVAVDLDMVHKMIELSNEFKETGSAALIALCDKYAADHGKMPIANKNSNQQIKDLLDIEGSLDKKSNPSIYDGTNVPEDKKKILQLRSSLSQSAVTKYDKILECVCADGRVRGLFKFYGAGTGRFTSRLVQLQNLKKNHFDDPAKAREYYMGNPQFSYQMLSDIGELIRTAFVPCEGKTFSDADYSAIEARVTAWLTGEQWVLDSFAQGKDIYCETASQMFSILRHQPVKVEKHGENAELRAVGKVATLACGYQGGVGAFERMGGSQLGMSQEDEKKMVDTWRAANPRTKNFWYKIEEFVRDVIPGPNGKARALIRTWAVPGCPEEKVSVRCRKMPYADAFQLEIELPVSHRKLVYPYIRIEPGTNKIMYTSARGSTDLYGGKLTENMVQGIARDILVSALGKLQEAEYPVVMHIHDEVLVEYPTECVDDIAKILASAAEPYKGLPLKAEGYQCDFFLKE